MSLFYTALHKAPHGPGTDNSIEAAIDRFHELKQKESISRRLSQLQMDEEFGRRSKDDNDGSLDPEGRKDILVRDQ